LKWSALENYKEDLKQGISNVWSGHKLGTGFGKQATFLNPIFRQVLSPSNSLGLQGSNLPEKNLELKQRIRNALRCLDPQHVPENHARNVGAISKPQELPLSSSQGQRELLLLLNNYSTSAHWI